MSNESMDELAVDEELLSYSSETVTGSECTGTEADSFDFHSESLESSDSESTLLKESGNLLNSTHLIDSSKTNSEVSCADSNEFSYGKGSDSDVFGDDVLSESEKELSAGDDVLHESEKELSAGDDVLPESEKELSAGDNVLPESENELSASKAAVDLASFEETFIVRDEDPISTDASSKVSISNFNLPNSLTNSAEVVSEHTVVEEETEKEAKSENAKQSPISPKSPTEALKALRISDTPSPQTKNNTPRKSRFRAKTTNIFDSPYNTRLKTRMMRERELRSQSEGGSSEEQL